MGSRTPRLFVVKFSALLHDPAWKPWVVSRAFPGNIGRVLARYSTSRPAGEEIDECRELVDDLHYKVDAHEGDAIIAVQKIFSDKRFRELVDEIIEEIASKNTILKIVDRVSASIDRWVHTYYSGEKVEVNIDEVKYVNPLDPRFKINVKTRVKPSQVCRFVKELRDIVMKARELPIPVIYNVLYLVLEPLWYKSCPECVPLADTRAPTHTVFDHIYASASISNWYLLGDIKPSGFLVKIDIPGIQKFISAARKTRDLWVGSWLISLLVWESVAEIVMVLGGDIVLSPFTLPNHFFIATLLKELQLHGMHELIKDIEKIASKSYLWRGVANQPVVPGTFFLALPCLDDSSYEFLVSEIGKIRILDQESRRRIRELLDALHRCDQKSVESIKRYFYDKFRDTWKAIAAQVISTYAKTSDRMNLNVDDFIDDFLEKIKCCLDIGKQNLDLAREYLRSSIDTPPLPLRVVVVDVEKEYDELFSEVVSRGSWGNIPPEEITNKLLFHYLFSASLPLKEYESLSNKVSVEQGFLIHAELAEITEKAYQGSGYHYCSICGKLPSIIHVREDTLKELADSLGIPPSMFTEGERLCPYCLIKRLQTLKIPLISVMDFLNLYIGKQTLVEAKASIYPRVPSTSELSAMNALMEVASVLLRKKDLRDQLKEYASKLCGELDKNAEYISEPLSRYIDIITESNEVLARDIKGIMGCLESQMELSSLMISGSLGSEELCSDSVDKYYNKSRDDIRKICRCLVEINKEVGDEGVGRYYVIIRGDGDFFGSRLIRGILNYESTQDYVEVLKEAIINKAKAGKLAKIYSNTSETLVKTIYNVLKNKISKYGMDIVRPTIIVTPSFYFALSRGQIITALIDAEIVKALAGFPVYAGGDDVVALAPTYISRGNFGDRLDEIVKRYLEVVGLQTGTMSCIRLDMLSSNVAGQIILYTRRNYWGLLGKYKGFHRLPIGSIYPAPVAYGRSYGVLATHYRDPFTPAWNTAWELEELKDKVIIRSPNSRDLVKDIVVLAYGRISGIASQSFEVSIIRNTIPSKPDVSTDYSLVAKPLENSLTIIEHVRRERLSRSVCRDLLGECSTFKHIDPSTQNDILLGLVRDILVRNAKNSDMEVVHNVLSLVKPYDKYIVELVDEGRYKLMCCPSKLIQVLITSHLLYSMER